MPIEQFARNRIFQALALVVLSASVMFLMGCSASEDSIDTSADSQSSYPLSKTPADGAAEFTVTKPSVVSAERELDDGLTCVLFDGDDYVDDFLASGGASSDQEVVSFLLDKLDLHPTLERSRNTQPFACSFLQARCENGGFISGRNFDWHASRACIEVSHPTDGYASVATVSKDFIDASANLTASLPENALPLVYEFAPLDGMNECGLCIAVLMIQDEEPIDQETGKPGLTTTTAVRVLLDKAASVEEALSILEGCDMHSSMGLTVHFALSDSTGCSVSVEYIGNQMIINESPVVTNFYLSPGPKNGIGSEQSHERYETLLDKLDSADSFDVPAMRDALESVSKLHFNDGETTEWSQVMDQKSMTITYFHREDYAKAYEFQVGRQP